MQTHFVASDANKKFRKSMEDAHKILSPLQGDISYYAVFDGHAGVACSQQCASQLDNIIIKELAKERLHARVLRNSFVEMDRQFSSIANSGSTACVALIDNKTKLLTVANVGDTRAVLSRSGEALRLSYDHKGSDNNEKQRITNSGGLLINNRVNGVLAVTRALGDLYMKDYVVGEPYTTETTLTADDGFLIVACDGLWDVCSDQQAVDIVKGCEIEHSAQELLTVALERGSMDNLTVMVIKL